ncbi:MAG: dTDP-4-dehydrorhamnose 3,5-epimerase [Pseudomonadota bacterium]
MDIEATSLPGVLILTPRRFGDLRGFFSETWNTETLHSHGIDLAFVQDNHSFSTEAGTVRGLHFQAPPRAQDKLVRCGRGALFDVAVDIRNGSPTYGQWTGVELSFENGRQLLVPKGFAHGFAALTDECEILYKCTDSYAPETEGAIHFADPEIGIDWHIDPSKAILSEKDRVAPDFTSFESPFTFEMGT